MRGDKYPEATTAAMSLGAVQARRLDITLRQNIDERIAEAEARAQALRDAKARMEASGLLDQRIDDVQEAMRW